MTHAWAHTIPCVSTRQESKEMQPTREHTWFHAWAHAKVVGECSPCVSTCLLTRVSREQPSHALAKSCGACGHVRTSYFLHFKASILISFLLSCLKVLKLQRKDQMETKTQRTPKNQQTTTIRTNFNKIRYLQGFHYFLPLNPNKIY